MPRKISDQAILEALRATMGRVCLAAERLGCAQAVIYERACRNKAIAGTIRFFRGKLLDAAESALWKAVLDGEGWAIRLVFDLWGRSRDFGDGAEAWLTPLTSHNAPADKSPSIEKLLHEPEYLEFLRKRREARDAGAVRGELQPRPLEDGAAPGGDRPGDHQYDRGTERTDPGG